MKLNKEQIENFQKKIWDFYKENRRDFPWRNTTDFYNILVSEIMLQQTQTFRVLPKYNEFIKKFPDFKSLSQAPFDKVLSHWKGLGYNRRALYLHNIAKTITNRHSGTDFVECSRLGRSLSRISSTFLESLPGIGKNTAASIIVFSTNKPLIFIETNIRRVFIHEFFNFPLYASRLTLVHDNELIPLIEQTLDTKNSRDWYYALMDYGAHLGKTISNPNRKSKHYTKQSKFEGSLRQVRGKILEILLYKSPIPISELKQQLKTTKEHFEKALTQLEKEHFLEVKNNTVTIKK